MFGVKKSRENEVIATIRLESDYCAENSFIFALFLILNLNLTPFLKNMNMSGSHLTNDRDGPPGRPCPPARPAVAP